MTCPSTHPIAGQCERIERHKLHRRDAVVYVNGAAWVTTTTWLDPESEREEAA